MKTRRNPGAFTLIETALALAVAGFCLVAIFGLLPVGLSSSQTALEQTGANGVLTAIVSDLRATTQKGAASSAQFSIPIPATPVATSPAATVLYFSASGESSTSLVGSSRYRALVTFLPVAGTKSATVVNITVTWPAQAQANAAGAVTAVVAIDRN